MGLLSSLKNLAPILGGAAGFALGGPAGAALGASLGGGISGSSSAKDAAQTQANAASEGNRLQWDMYQQSRADQQPWRDAGMSALGKLSQFSGQDLLNNDPGYQFRLDQGLGAVNRLAAGSGMLNSGATLKALNDYAQGTASQEYGNAWNRQAGLAGIGQTANNTMANLGQNAASNVSAGLNNIGAAAASGQVGSANAWTNAINSGMNAWLGQDMYNRIFPSVGGAKTGMNAGGYDATTWGF